jgi:hypothetical protein
MAYNPGRVSTTYYCYDCKTIKFVCKWYEEAFGDLCDDCARKRGLLW